VIHPYMQQVPGYTAGHSLIPTQPLAKLTAQNSSFLPGMRHMEAEIQDAKFAQLFASGHGASCSSKDFFPCTTFMRVKSAE